MFEDAIEWLRITDCLLLSAAHLPPTAASRLLPDVACNTPSCVPLCGRLGDACELKIGVYVDVGAEVVLGAGMHVDIYVHEGLGVGIDVGLGIDIGAGADDLPRTTASRPLPLHTNAWSYPPNLAPGYLYVHSDVGVKTGVGAVDVDTGVGAVDVDTGIGAVDVDSDVGAVDVDTGVGAVDVDTGIGVYLVLVLLLCASWRESRCL